MNCSQLSSSFSSSRVYMRCWHFIYIDGTKLLQSGRFGCCEREIDTIIQCIWIHLYFRTFKGHLWCNPGKKYTWTRGVSENVLVWVDISYVTHVCNCCVRKKTYCLQKEVQFPRKKNKKIKKKMCHVQKPTMFKCFNKHLTNQMVESCFVKR